MAKYHSLTRRISLSVGATLLVLSSLIVVIVDHKMVELTALNQQEQLAILASEAQRAIDTAAEQAVMAALVVAGQPSVQKAFAEQQRDTLREEFLPGWPALKQGGVRQFQFHLPPATSYLRIHMPEKYGDDLSAFRQTVVVANTEKRVVSGLENGVAGLGIRGVVPVAYNGSHVGTVEFGGDLSAEVFTSLTSNEHVRIAAWSQLNGKLKPLFGDQEPPATLDMTAVLAGGNSEFNYTTEQQRYHGLAVPLRDYSGSAIGVLALSIDLGSSEALIADSRWNIITIAVLTTVALGVLLYWRLRRSVVAIHHTVACITELADGVGTLASRIKGGGDDETEKLATAFNRFVERIEKMVNDIAQVSDAMLTECNTLSDRAANSMKTAQLQSDQTTQIATAMNEMTVTVRDVAHNSAQAADAAVDADQQANTGVAVVAQSIEAIQSLAKQVHEAGELVQSVEGSSARIGSVLEVIRTIAEQTNLLALNAAIEAARAGEHGRGFAVVADEVRTLAKRTQESTAEIQSTIAELQHSVNATVDVIHASRVHAESSVKSAQTVGVALASIKRAVDTINEMNTQIATASEEQTSVSEEISSNVTTINDLCRDTAGAATATSKAAIAVTELSDRLSAQIGSFSQDQAALAEINRATGSHLAWKTRLAGYLAGSATLTASEAVDHHQCRLGRWYEGEGRQHYGDISAFKEIEGPHRELHALIKRIVSAVEAGDRRTAETLFRDIDPLSQRVVTCLHQLHKEIA